MQLRPATQLYPRKIRVEGDLRDVCDAHDLSDFGASALLVLGSLFNLLEDTVWNGILLFALVMLRIASIFVNLVIEPAVYIQMTIMWALGKPVKDRISFVNFANPIFLEYTPDNNLIDELLTNTTEQHAWNIDLATYFAVLSAAVYENNHVHVRLFERYGFPIHKQTRILMSTSCAATIVTREVNGKLVILVIFKGTSPFDINEYWKDAAIQKIDTYVSRLKYGSNLNGEIHAGFDNALTHPPVQQNDMPTERDTERRNNNVEPPQPSSMDLILQEVGNAIATFRDKQLMEQKEFTPENDVCLWLSGHSLGAALATLFTSFVLTAPEDVQASCPSDRFKKFVPDVQRSLKGIYTIGNPRVGSRDTSEQTNRILREKNIQFYRMRNCNDMIGISPPGSGMVSEIFEDAYNVQNIDPTIPKVQTLTNYGEIGEEYRLSRFGGYWEPSMIPPYTPTQHRGSGLIRRILSWVVPAYISVPIEIVKWAFFFERVVMVHMLPRVKKYLVDFPHTVWYCALVWVNLLMCGFQYFFSFFKSPPADPLDSLVERPTLLLMIGQFLAPSIIFDHIPCNYVRHLHMIKRRG